MTYYIGLVHKDSDSAFGVQFPDLPGCFSAADSMDDLVGNASEALSLWAEDTALPAARSIEQIVADRDIAAELAAGAFLISVPFMENDTRVVSANISLERGVLKAIDAAAKRRKLTRSAFLAQAARREIER
ncbi:MAG: type II toxin-antitoxin system HicB family antitoxin [Aestuariivirga sp.]